MYSDIEPIACNNHRPALETLTEFYIEVSRCQRLPLSGINNKIEIA